MVSIELDQSNIIYPTLNGEQTKTMFSYFFASKRLTLLSLNIRWRMKMSVEPNEINVLI